MGFKQTKGETCWTISGTRSLQSLSQREVEQMQSCNSLIAEHEPEQAGLNYPKPPERWYTHRFAKQICTTWGMCFHLNFISSAMQQRRHEIPVACLAANNLVGFCFDDTASSPLKKKRKKK